jgi:uncharacterized protein DUF6894
MPWYYFDIRDGDALFPDEEGLDLADQRAAEVEAAHSLAGLAKELPAAEERHSMAIEVRTKSGPVFQLAFLYPALSTRH